MHAMTRRKVRIGGHAIHRARGFSLIEVLIALLVLALGLLGLAFLQVLNVRYTQSAAHRTMATNYAYELLDLIRVNQQARGEYDAMAFDSTTVAIPPGGCGRATGLDAGHADDNIARWQCEVVSNLPDASGNVAIAADGTATVTIAWGDDVGQEDDTDPSAPQTTSFVVTSRL